MIKRGITFSMLAIVVLVLAILATAVVTSVKSSIDNSKLSIWVTEISLVQNHMKENYAKQNDMLLDEVVFDVSKIPSEIVEEQFNGEELEDNTIILYEVNLAKLGMNNVVYGRYSSENDVYVYSKKTRKVYYLKGMKGDKNQVYYTLTDKLKNRYDNQPITDNKLSTVVFEPSSVDYTNQPITVFVKVPTSYTDIEITTSNSNVLVGEPITEGSKYTYLVNIIKYAGNYEIYVSYNDGSEDKEITYAVTVYDNEAPVISSAIKLLDKVTIDAYDTISGIKEIRYIIGEIEEENIQQYFKTYGLKVKNTTFKVINSPDLPVTIYVQDYAGNYSIQKAIVTIPDDWKNSVSEVTEDAVPIPKGFVKSPYAGEQTKNKGLVIYALTEQEIENEVTDITEIDATKQVSLENRNQFVWVPVDRNNFDALFRRKDFINQTSAISYKLGETDKYWELVLEINNMPSNSTKNTTDFVSTYTLEEATAMYESVKKYGGFYIARYEVGKNNTGALSITMGKYPYSRLSWGTSMSNEDATDGAVTLSRAFYPSDATTYGAVSTLTYGVEWDRTLNWWKELNPNFDLINSTNYGVYYDTVIALTEYNEGAKYSPDAGGAWYSAKAKKEGDDFLMTTGAYQKANIYNIYDMAGNLAEWTMEGNSANNRVIRGGFINQLHSR